MNVKFKKSDSNKNKITNNIVKSAAIIGVALIIVLGGYYAYSKFFAKPDNVEVSNIPNVGVNDPAKSQNKALISVYKASKDIKIGEPIDVSKYYVVSVPADTVPQNVVKSASEFKETVAVEFLHSNEVILGDALGDAKLWLEDTDRLVEHAFTEGCIPAAVVENSVIDIKLFNQKGEDPYVISKAIVISRTGNTLTFYLNRLEQELLKQAAAEGNIFAVVYYNYNQPAAEPTYIPKYGALSLDAKKTSTTNTSNDENSFADTGFNQ